ncbi:MAG: hypothetical protein Q9220_004563 [cf. Caloplaca sp. 1 TL-2023]
MILRPVRFCSIRTLASFRKSTFKPRCRLYSSTVASEALRGSPFSSALVGITSQLDQIVPRIDIQADQIDVLVGPQEFYETLKQKIRSARRRIYLSTLYIGKSEDELISTIHEALANNPKLKVSILTDALRGTREDPSSSCASLLAPLITAFPDRVEIRMYHTPNLTGWRKRFIPKRINEGWGLQHIKLYGIDDEVILSGANLSSDYFTNRQDRYHVFSSKRVADYYSRIHHAVCSISFLLQPTSKSHTLLWPSSNPAPNPLSNPKDYIKAATSVLLPLSLPSATHTPPATPPSPTLSSTKTTIYPLLSLPPTKINTELPALRALLSPTFSSTLASYTFTAGYFNPHPLITRTLLSLSSTGVQGTILTAHPHANGFYGSPGISSLLPPAYSHLALRFLSAARRARAEIRLREWKRGVVGEEGGWTYHAKGVWAYFRPFGPRSAADTEEAESKNQQRRAKGVEAAGPAVTVIGSSNYTTRSYNLDLEVGAMVVTEDENLMGKWKREEENLRMWTREVGEGELKGEDRRAGWRVRGAMWIVRILGGAL